MACRTASAVTAQVLTMMALPSPPAVAWRRIAADSAMLSRQPNVMSLGSNTDSARGSTRDTEFGSMGVPGHVGCGGLDMSGA